MRNIQPSRRVVVQIMKSPSPDIANRNIIRQTKAPVDDIKKHLVEKSRSKSPRIIDRPQNLDQLQYFRRRIQQLEKIVRQLKIENGQYRKLMEQKKPMQNPNLTELSKMRETIRSYDGSQSPTPRNEKDKAAKLLQHMQNKMMEVLNQNKRIGNLLQEKQNENKRLKNQLESKDQSKPLTPRNLSQSQNQSQFQNNPIDPNRLKTYFQTFLSPQIQKSQVKWLSIIRDMQSKINMLKQRQDLLEKQYKNKNQSPVLQNKKKSPFSNAKTSQPSDSIFPSGYYHPYSIRPFEDITKSGQKEQDDPGYLQIQQRCLVLQKDNETYRKKIIDLENQNQRMKQNSTLNTRVTTFENDEQTRKNFQLQRELDEKSYKINTIQRQLRSVQQDYNRLKQRTDRQFYLLQNQKNTCKKALQQQKQKYNLLEDSYSKLSQRNQLTEQKLREKEQAHEKLSHQIKQMIKEWANKQNNIKNYYNELLKNKDKQFGEELHKYLQLLDNIRKDIQSCNIDQVITENQAFGLEKISLEKELLLIREENKKLLYELKSRLVQQEQRIIQLEKDNQMLRTQVRQLENQKQKLKKAMLQFDNFKVMSHNMTSSSSINSVQQATYKSESGCKLKACLKQTIKKIDNLEQQITQILME